jgi:hypothetical protein
VAISPGVILFGCTINGLKASAYKLGVWEFQEIPGLFNVKYKFTSGVNRQAPRLLQIGALQKLGLTDSYTSYGTTGP